MDFVTIATETSLRRLLGDASSGSDAAADPSIMTGSGNTSKLSKTSEAELYLLATNFLLYVAMVIITILVTKIYFPDRLERRDVDDDRSASPRARSFAYRMALAGSEEYYGSDASSDGSSDDVDEILDSDDDEEDEDNDRLIKMSYSGESTHTVDTMDTRQRISYFLDPRESLGRSAVLKRLVFCSLMLNMIFVTWGLLQERILTRRYPRYTGEYFTYSYFLVFTNRFWTLIMSGFLMAYLKPTASRSTVIWEYSFPSISNMLSSWCQYEALRYVSFPATTLFKSFKLAPVMVMGTILRNKTYPLYDYVVAFMIGVGIAMFMASTDSLQFGLDYLGDEAPAAWTGVMLLFLFLFFDSFTSQFQSRMFQRNRDLSMVELMFATSAFSAVLSFVTLLHTKELYPALRFVKEHNEIHLHIFMFSVCSTIGQLFIFYTIKNFGAVVFTLIMTTRILLSIAISCVLYGHEVTATGFFGLMLVMASILYRIRRKAENSQIIKWQGMEKEDDEKAQELVNEWHEHVDM